ncbi:DUF4112 domain-containing protein [Hymenobacter busanensis]|uniref:DUF4112 domain-containing protein n=1 Tax=Hymenobacter busanensis TaxID=2607656 RepID=A0A7L4ZTN9_9BACT|nr:DUF4112 domain-containing protein [Hymenobacter busanensis]KAA9327496.1 DUF4112 domain-containing protein [Hymenobacter busanensis]QHJ06166.1 DUF4112 domain-containing protein [Hymenobacter busanensis]
MAAPTRSQTVTASAATDPRLRWVTQVAQLMDSQFRLPGTNFRFGLDPILGFIPVVGELGTFAISAALIVTMARYGASRKLVILMVLNALLDTVVGSIPIIGNLFDFTYKSNERNVRLLQRHYLEGKHQGSGTGLVVALAVGLLLVLGLLGWGLWKVLLWLWEYGQQHWTY